MDETQIKHVLEAALLAAGRPLPLDKLASLFSTKASELDSATLLIALEALASDYKERGLELKEVSTGYRIQIKRSMSDWLTPLWEERAPRYTRALLETMALVAYRQPITRAEIEEVRGVAVSTNIMRTLLERNWVRVVGHRDVPGKPAMFGTTKDFLDYFGLKRLEDLPPLADVKDGLPDLNPQGDLVEALDIGDGDAEQSGSDDAEEAGSAEVQVVIAHASATDDDVETADAAAGTEADADSAEADADEAAEAEAEADAEVDAEAEVEFDAGDAEAEAAAEAGAEADAEFVADIEAEAELAGIGTDEAGEQRDSSALDEESEADAAIVSLADFDVRRAVVAHAGDADDDALDIEQAADVDDEVLTAEQAADVDDYVLATEEAAGADDDSFDVEPPAGIDGHTFDVEPPAGVADDAFGVEDPAGFEAGLDEEVQVDLEAAADEQEPTEDEEEPTEASASLRRLESS